MKYKHTLLIASLCLGLASCKSKNNGVARSFDKNDNKVVTQDDSANQLEDEGLPSLDAEADALKEMYETRGVEAFKKQFGAVEKQLEKSGISFKVLNKDERFRGEMMTYLKNGEDYIEVVGIDENDVRDIQSLTKINALSDNIKGLILNFKGDKESIKQERLKSFLLSVKVNRKLKSDYKEITQENRETMIENVLKKLTEIEVKLWDSGISFVKNSSTQKFKLEIDQFDVRNIVLVQVVLETLKKYVADSQELIKVYQPQARRKFMIFVKKRNLATFKIRELERELLEQQEELAE